MESSPVKSFFVKLPGESNISEISIKTEPAEIQIKEENDDYEPENEDFENCIQCGKSYRRLPHEQSPYNSETRLMCSSCTEIINQNDTLVYIKEELPLDIDDYDEHSQTTLDEIEEQKPLKPIYGRCKLCKWESDSNYRLKKHFQEVHPSLEFNFEIKCNDCNVFFISVREYRTHRDHKHRIRERYKEYVHGKCKICSRVFVGYENNIKIHFKNKHPQSEYSVEYKCRVCDEFFNSRLEVKEHSNTHKEGKVRKKITKTVFGKCGICKKVFSTKYGFDRHFGRDHPGSELNIEYKCQLCDVFLKTNIKIHYMNEHKKKSVKKESKPKTIFGQCCLCKKTLSSKHVIDIHFTKKHPGAELNVDYTCLKCHEVFKSANDFKRHRKIHRRNLSPKAGN